MRKFPFISLGFFFLSVLWFLYVTITFGTTENNTILYQNGAILGNCFTPAEWWRLISPIFAHIGVPHLVSNMVLLLTLGTLIEKIIGHLKFSLLYIISGVGGNLAVILLNPDTITAGASTALYGLLGFLFIQLFNKHNKLLRNIGFSYIGLIAINIFYTFTNPNVSLVGHLGGFITGILFGLLELDQNYD